MTNGKAYVCPLCDGAGQTLELDRGDGRQIECEYCTTYEITYGLEGVLADNPTAKGRALYLSAATRNATYGMGPNLLICCLKLNQENYQAIASVEESFQQHVKPVVDYLVDRGIEVQAKQRFVHLELYLPDNKRSITLKVEDSLFTDWTAAELKAYCKDYDIAGKLAKTPPGKPVEFTRCDAKPRFKEQKS